jgi:hypothetical protein
MQRGLADVAAAAQAAVAGVDARYRQRVQVALQRDAVGIRQRLKDCIAGNRVRQRAGWDVSPFTEAQQCAGLRRRCHGAHALKPSP